MTEPSAHRPVPGPPRPAPPSTPAPDARPDTAPGGAPQDRLPELEGLPVAEHVAVFEAEHERLQRELGTIDPL